MGTKFVGKYSRWRSVGKKHCLGMHFGWAGTTWVSLEHLMLNTPPAPRLSSRWCSVGLGIVGAVRKQSFGFLPQTSPLPLPSYNNGTALSTEVVFIIALCFHGGKFCKFICIAKFQDVGLVTCPSN